MPTYYVRTSGSDSNAGTSPSTAWRTIGKALGASGISSGDVVYIGAGTYRETVTVAMTSATAETKIIGDVTGQYTGDAGEVIWSAFTNGDFADVAFGGSSVTCNLAGRSYLTFENLTFIGGNNNSSTGGSCITAATTTSTNITLRNCTLFSTRHGTSAAFVAYAVAAFGTSLNWLIDGCRMFSLTGGIQFVATTSASGADYDLKVTIQNSWLFAPNTSDTGSISVGASGTATYRGNGVAVINCAGIGAYLIGVGANTSLTYPSTVRNCTYMAIGRDLYAQTSGMLTDLGGNRFWIANSTGLTNVTKHATTRTGVSPNLFPLELGQSAVLGLPYRHPLMPYAASGTFPGGALGFGNVSGGTSTSITGRARPSGIGVLYGTGTATAATTSTLSDSGKAWGVDQLKGKLVRTLSGTGSGQTKRISSNSASQIVISGAAPAGGLWATTPSTDTTYVIYDGPQVETGKATSGAATTLTDSGANWATNQWAGYTVEITGGSGVGSATVTSNTATALSVASWPNGTPDNTSTYSLYWPGGSVTATQPSAGAFELGDTARAETTVTDSGTGVRIDGPGSQDLTLPVDTTATTVTVRARYDSNHGTGSKPQVQLLAAGELGVILTTATMTSAADTWETLTIGPFTPTAAGVVTLRLISRSATPYGVAYFDTIGVT